MSYSNVYVYNLLVHYGEAKDKVFIDLLEEGVFEELIDNPDMMFRKKEQFVEDLSVFNGEDSIFLYGKFSKQFNFHSDRVKENNQRKNKMVDVEALPYSYFYIDLKNHRLVWIKPRNITGCPSAQSFCSFLKQKSCEYMYRKYLPEAESTFYNDLSENKGSKRKYISKYIQRLGITKKYVELKPLALVDEGSIRNIIMSEEYLVKKIRMRVFKPNANNREIDGAKGQFDEIAKLFNDTLGANPELEIKRDDNKPIENKENVVKLASMVNEAQNIEVDVTLQNKNNKKETQTLSSNPSDHKSDIKFKKEINKEGQDVNHDDILLIKDEVDNYEINEVEARKNLEIANDWVKSLKIRFPTFSIFNRKK